MSCGAQSPRLEMHERCLALNPEFAEMDAVALPDGDADIETDFSTLPNSRLLKLRRYFKTRRSVLWRHGAEDPCRRSKAGVS